MDSSIEFSTLNNKLLFPLLFLSLFLSYLAYRNSTYLSRGKRNTLIFLRTSSLFLALSLLIEPVFSLKTTFETSAPFGLFIDNTESMAIKDNNYSRSDLLIKTLDENGSEFKSMGNPLLYSFGETVKPRKSVDTLAFMEKETNLSRVIKKVSELATKQQAQSAIIFSDGQFTSGKNPIYPASNSPVPIHTVLVGDTTSPQDIILKKPIAPKISLQGLPISISVPVIQKNFNGKSTNILLTQDNQPIEKKKLVFQSRELIVNFQFNATGKGVQRYNLYVEPIYGEFSKKNNKQSFFIEILSRKKKVLVISGSPDPEISAVKNTLALNDKLSSTFLTLKTPTSFFEGTFNPSNFQDIDMCILIGFPNDNVSNKVVTEVSKFLTSKKIPVFSILTFLSKGKHLKSFEKFLPVTINENIPPRLYENIVLGESTSYASTSSIFKNFSSSIQSALQQASPISYYDYELQLRKSTLPLFTASINGASTNKVLFAVSRTPSVKHGIMLGLQFWKLSLSPDQEIRDLYKTVILGSIEWLTTKEDTKKIKISPSAQIFDHLSPISFIATAQDDVLEPTSTAKIRLVVKNLSTKQEFETYFQPEEQVGLYKASFDALPKGNYLYQAISAFNGSATRKITGRFSIEELNQEFFETQADLDVMKLIAERSGGEFYLLNNFSNFWKSNLAKLPRLEKSNLSHFPLFGKISTLIIILLLLVLEWALKKYYKSLV